MGTKTEWAKVVPFLLGPFVPFCFQIPILWPFQDWNAIDAESDPMTQSESNVQSFQKIWTLSYHLGHGQLFLQTSRMYGYGQERKHSRDLDKTLRWGFGFRLFSSSICLSFTISPTVLHQRKPAPPPFFPKRLASTPLRIEMQWKVQDWNRDFFFTKNLSKRRGPDLQACGLFLWRSHRQLIRRGSCTTQTAARKRRGYSNAPGRLGRWLVACPVFFHVFTGVCWGFERRNFFGARGLFQTPKVTGFEVKGFIKWKVKKTQECTRNWLEWIPNTSEPNLVSSMEFKVPIPSSRILRTKHCLIERWKQIYAFTTGGDKHYHNWL